MDKKTAIALLAGTLVRVILCGSAFLAGKYGIETMSQGSADGIAYFVAALVVAVVSIWWSKRKDNKLLATPAPKE